MTERVVPQAEQIHVDLDPAETLAAYVRHRTRFADEASTLDEHALGVPSRCSKWTVADVLRHCADVDDWMLALWSGGRPPFTEFDPVTTPHEFVVAARAMRDVDARDRYVASTARLIADVDGSGAERWDAFGVSPLGIVPWWLSVTHVFWDSWLHERDALLPLGADVPVPGDETLPILTYSLALVGTLIEEPTEHVVAGVRMRTGQKPVVVTPVVGPSDVHPDTPGMVDALNGRGELDDLLPGADRDLRHQLGAMARLFRTTA